MTETNNSLHEKLARFQWLLQRHHLQNHAERGPFGDPARGQGRVLAMLKMQPEISTKDMVYLLGIRQQSLNELLNKLEKSGYVARTPSEADKRVMIVRLTEKGKNEQHDETDFGDIFDCLNEDEQKSFIEYIDRIIAALESQLGVDAGEDLSDWMRSARSRMGDEQFERLMSVHGRHGVRANRQRGERFGNDCGFGHDHHRQAAYGMPKDGRFDPRCNCRSSEDREDFDEPRV